jgi:FG-GAP repeat
MKFLRNCCPSLVIVLLYSLPNSSWCQSLRSGGGSSSSSARKQGTRQNAKKTDGITKTVCKTDCGDGLCVTTNYFGVSFSRCERCQPSRFVKAIGLDKNGKLICENIDECASPLRNDCNPKTQICVDSDSDGYVCEDIKVKPSLDFIPLKGENVKVAGYYDDSYLGYSVAYAGDINGDGIDDIIIGSPEKNSEGEKYAGYAYIVFGRVGGIAADLLSDTTLLDGSNGFAVAGKRINDNLGISVAYAGDINNDGIDDVIIGAPGGDVVTPDGTFAGNAGEAYILFGSKTTFPPIVSAFDIIGDVGMTVQGRFIVDDLGESVSYAGDVNGDGIDDVIIGAPRADPEDKIHAGEAYVIFGSKKLPDVLHVSELDGSNGFSISGKTRRDMLGTSVSNAGDINGDGISDVIVGAPVATSFDGISGGAAYIIFGRKSGFPKTVRTGDLDGDNGFAVLANGRERLGFSVSSAGDMNGDGIDDCIIGAPRAGLFPLFASGNVYILYGSKTRTRAVIAADKAGVTITGRKSFDGFGTTVSYARDINNDGIDDIIIGSAYGSEISSLAEAYIIYGDSKDLPSTMTVDSMEKKKMGKTLQLLPETFDGMNDYSLCVSSAGDFNGDGLNDVIVGLPSIDRSDRSTEGQVFLFFE